MNMTLAFVVIIRLRRRGAKEEISTRTAPRATNVSEESCGQWHLRGMSMVKHDFAAHDREARSHVWHCESHVTPKHSCSPEPTSLVPSTSEIASPVPSIDIHLGGALLLP